MPNRKHRPALDGGVITPPPLEKLLRNGSEVHKMAEGERGTGQAKNCPSRVTTSFKKSEGKKVKVVKDHGKINESEKTIS